MLYPDLLKLAIAVGAVAIAVVLWLWVKRQNQRRILPRPSELIADDPLALRDFRNVFFNLTEVDRERIIKVWMNRSQCSRSEAMRLAVEDWRKDQRTWR